ncbi:MAG: hypothetical protein ACLP6W_13830 [Bryobacteraceae bacterium]
MNQPASVAVDAAGKVYISDIRNHVVRVLVPDSPDRQPRPEAAK